MPFSAHSSSALCTKEYSIWNNINNGWRVARIYMLLTPLPIMIEDCRLPAFPADSMVRVPLPWRRSRNHCPSYCIRFLAPEGAGTWGESNWLDWNLFNNVCHSSGFAGLLCWFVLTDLWICPAVLKILMRQDSQAVNACLIPRNNIPCLLKRWCCCRPHFLSRCQNNIHKCLLQVHSL